MSAARALLCNRLMRDAATLWLGTRLALLAVTIVVAPLLAARVIEYPHPPAPIADAWYVWDARAFVQIATSGYSMPTLAAWFPLYPLLIRLSMALTLGLVAAPVLAQYLSNIATLAAFCLLAQFGAREYGYATARSAVLMLAAWPFAFFLAIGYSDALFLALAIAALSSARQRRWWICAACAFLAGLTRITAVVLLLALLVEAATVYDWHKWRAWLPTWAPVREGAAAAVLAVPASLGMYAVYNWLQFGRPDQFLHTESADFGRHLVGPWTSLGMAVSQIRHASTPYLAMRPWLDVLPVLALVVVTAAALRTLPRSLAVYQCALLLLVLVTPLDAAHAPESALAASGRYLLASVPAWLALGRWTARWPALEANLAAFGFMLQALLLAVLVGGGWII